MNQIEFEQTVADAFDALPEKFKKKIENVGFVVEKEVRPAELQERGIRFHGTLLGLYQGVPLSKRGVNYSLVLPDKITLFKNSIEQLASNDDQKTKALVQKVLYHEIGHYFGLNESEVRGWEQRRKNNKQIS
ncbi:MAG: hypothetical protein COT24_01925 [Candidatus Kerfeldbacteria bacterium CG08_land_8_20_14_0_20_40_16]|uniref:Metallopeptidase family protein n=1 Tax=Candidatus Kerfeldbacteria bacterium CG08_land_8_20_14_0_20_40_16 TaxID=2014244 RepID=A0A2H0YW73_9BACT|nr:MAG: hypothetical protein COT24_01925 [Candidatus Kerfeldbacteria bacterium CG08_land_8_20_14_0_20_40_16]